MPADYAQAIAITSIGGYRNRMSAKSRYGPPLSASVRLPGFTHCRAFALLPVILCLFLVSPLRAQETDAFRAKAQVEKLVAVIDDVARMSADAPIRRRALLRLLPGLLDMPAIAAFLAGPPGKRPSAPGMRDRHLEAFAAVLPAFLVRDLGIDPARLRGFRHEIDRTIPVADGYDIYAHVLLPRRIGGGFGGQRLNLTWRVQEGRAGGGMRIADLRIGGISLLQLLRPLLVMRTGLGREGLASVVARMRKAADCRPAVIACGG